MRDTPTIQKIITLEPKELVYPEFKRPKKPTDSRDASSAA